MTTWITLLNLSIFSILVALFPNPVFSKTQSANKQDFDIATMVNGNIYIGTLAIEKLTLKTALGDISIPYHALKNLNIEHINNQNKARLTTQTGETLYGQILNKKIMMLRVVDPSLPLSIAETSSISFAARGIASTPVEKSPDVIISRNGDQLLGKIQQTTILKDFITNRNNLRYVDFANLEDEDKTLGQISLLDNTVHQGQIEIDNIHFKTRYGQSLNVAINTLSGLRFNVKHEDKSSVFMHRWQKKPATLFRDPLIDGGTGPEMVVIKGKTFLRGDTQGDEDENPPTPVTPGNFAIGVFEVTYREYDQFCEDTGRDKPDDANWGRANHPVINVTWKDAVAYTEWLSRKTRKHYRLPSDAEWEFAARAGSKTKFWWGDKVGIARANCEGCKSLWDGTQTAPVGRFQANPFGLHDTAGNVFEWVADCWHDKFSDAPADGSPIKKTSCGKRVIRGGAWSFPAKEIRSANRWRDFPSRRSDDTGFRVARDVE